MKRTMLIHTIAFLSILIIGGFIGHFSFPKAIDSIEVIVSPEIPRLQIATIPFNTLEVVLSEPEGKVTITGLNKDDLWLGHIKGISMFPTMRTEGCATIVEKVGKDSIAIGDILVFKNPITGEWVGHRVSNIGNDTQGWYAETLADNKNTALGKSTMGHKIREDTMLGKVRIYLDY